ncbi:MAG TPA: hypothetical protein VK705_07540 [Ferruginibacter sp.]|jgi:hypothetical protein|nr:hypothetical protein [Ferruginibacter sp.]
MNNKIHTNNSEKKSQQKTEECKTLCAHSWNSIYNNFHPIRRLPSITISIILISFLFFTGYVNARTSGKKTVSKQPETLSNLHNKTNDLLTKEAFSNDNMNQKTFMQITILSNN